MRIILDSGAYSALTRGVEIDVHEYADFYEGVRDHVDVVVNLDVIPRSMARNEVEEAAKQSRRNLLALWKRDVPALPVYHIGESKRWLDWMMTESFYIGLGGIAKVRPSARRQWLKDVFNHIGGRGFEHVSVHGFGMTSSVTMFEFPWSSVDSNRWVFLGAGGQIAVPVRSKGRWDFSRSPFEVIMSDRTGPVKGSQPDWRGLGPASKKAVESWLSFCGLTSDRVIDDLNSKMLVNVRFLQEAAKQASCEVFFVERFCGTLDVANEPRRLISYATLPKSFDIGRYTKRRKPRKKLRR